MDRREQIAHLAATREEEMLLVRVCEKLDTAVQRDIPAATNFLSKREQMLVCEVLRGAPIRFFGGLFSAAGLRVGIRNEVDDAVPGASGGRGHPRPHYLL